MSNLPTVSVVIPCRNEKDDIERSLRSILAQVSPASGFELIVADGMSEDGTRDILKRLLNEDPRIRLVENPGLIVSTGLNAAIQAARGPIIARMDAHTEYANDYLCQCLEVLHESGADNVGGPWIAKGRGYVGRAIAAAFQSPFAVGGARAHNPKYTGPVDNVYLGCWPREIFDRLGFFDTELIRNQDDEFNLRITRAGGTIWQSPRIKSWYKPRESLKSLFKQYLQYGYWKVRVIQKHKIPASIRHVIPGLFLFLTLGLMIASPWWNLARWGWFGLAGMYILCNLMASFLTAMRREWKLLFLLPAVFACYHFAYATGFLHGVWDFVIMRRAPKRAFTDLTRDSTQSPIG